MSDVTIVVEEQPVQIAVEGQSVQIAVEEQPVQIVVQEESVRIVVVEEPVKILTVGIQGPQGPPGPASPGTTYIYSQNTPSTTWTIAHNLGQYPSVTVVDSGGTVVLGDVTYNSADQITLTFGVSHGGKAYLN